MRNLRGDVARLTALNEGMVGDGPGSPQGGAAGSALGVSGVGDDVTLLAQKYNRKLEMMLEWVSHLFFMEADRAFSFWTNMSDCALFVLQDRENYVKCDQYDNADLVWISTEKFNKFFTDSFNRLSKQSVYMNHIPNFFEITRKDLLSININKF